MTARPTKHEALHALFHPRAVAVTGASGDTTKHGYIVLTNIRNTGFKGGIYGVSRRLTEIEGIPCLPEIGMAPEPVDTAFLAIPAEAAVQAVRDCARAGLKAVIVGSAGYAESLDAGGAERQRELARIADESGIRVVGPNCNGMYNAHFPISVGFNTSHAKRQTPGGTSIFSHSGALFDAMAGRLAMLGAGLSPFASAGNEADLSVLDYMEYALTHEPTRVIALLIDSLDDGARFRRLALEAYRLGKPVVALKIGGSEAGAAAAVAHSSRLAGDDAAYRALFRAAGVATVQTLEGLMTAAALLDRYGSRPGALGALSTSGAGASLIADRCEALGVPLAQLSPETYAAIDAHKVFSRIGNPLDLGIFGGMRKSADVPKLLLTDPSVSVGLALVHSMNPWQGDPYRVAMGAAREASGVPLLLVTPGGLPEAEQKTYRDLGIDLFTDTDILLEGIGALLAPGPDEEAASLIKAFADSGFATVTAKPGDPSTATAKRGDSSTVAAKPGSPSTVMAGLVPAIHDFASAVATVPALPGRPLTEPESLRLLAGFGVKTVETVECASATDAVAAANRLGYPIVLKGVAEGVTHKSDFGLVHVALRDADAVARAYEATGCARVIVQPMIHGDLEAIAGISRSEGVGLVLIAGLGGIFAEALRDTVTLPIPSSQPAVERALARSSLGRILAGPRWKHPDSAAALTSLLMSLQDAALALGDRVQAIDVNPVILGADGAVAVDALVVPTA